MFLRLPIDPLPIATERPQILDICSLSDICGQHSVCNHAGHPSVRTRSEINYSIFFVGTVEASPLTCFLVLVSDPTKVFLSTVQGLLCR